MNTSEYSLFFLVFIILLLAGNLNQYDPSEAPTGLVL